MKEMSKESFIGLLKFILVYHLILLCLALIGRYSRGGIKILTLKNNKKNEKKKLKQFYFRRA